MSALELTEWMAFFELEPHGEQRMDMHFARLMYLTAQMQSKKRLQPAEFYPRFRWEEQAETTEQAAKRVWRQFEVLEHGTGKRR
jgi:hypothetical protein